MKKEEIVLKIPYGTRDFLPNEAMAKRQIEDAVASVFVKWGYEEIVSPTFEFLETLTIGNNDEMQQNMFKFFDKDNTTLGLRYDMTTPIARVASTRLNEEKRPLKLSYIANVFRYEQAQMGRQCEFYQAGVELMGVCQASADAEVIALSIETLRRAGLENFQISLGQIQFINGVMEESGLSKEKLALLNANFVSHMPNVTFWLDAPTELGMSRARARGALDRFEQEKATFFEKVRSGYQELWERQGERIKRLDATQTPEQVFSQALTCLQSV